MQNMTKKHLMALTALLAVFAVATAGIVLMDSQGSDAASYTGTNNQTMQAGDTWTNTFTVPSAQSQWTENFTSWVVDPKGPGTAGDSISSSNYMGLSTSSSSGSLYAYYDGVKKYAVVPDLTVTCTPSVIGTYTLQVAVGDPYGLSSYVWTITFTISNPSPYYTISYDANGGFTSALTQSVPQGKSIKLYPTAPVTVGGTKTFTGWKVGTTSTTLQPGQSYTPSASVTLYAQWNDSSGNTYYNIIYDANGGSGAPSNQSYTGTEASHTFTISSTQPTKSGYTFAGWAYGSATGYYGSGTLMPGQTFTMSTAASTLTLTATWTQTGNTAIEFRVKYNLNGGTGNTPADSYATSTLNSYSFTTSSGAGITPPSGKVLKGWSTSSTNPTVAYGLSTTIIVQRSTPTVTLYAVYETVTTSYSVSYDANGGTDAPSMQKYTGTETSYTFTVPMATPNKTDYVLKYWTAAKAGTGSQYSPGDKITLSYQTPTLTLYAQWTALTSNTVSFDANGGGGGGTNVTVSQNVMTGNAITLPSIGYTKTGYFQSGWAEGSATGTTYTMGQTYTVMNAVKFYALWSPLPTSYFDTNAPSTATVGVAWSYKPDLNASSTPYYFYPEILQNTTSKITTVNPPAGFTSNYTYKNLSLTWTPAAPGVYLIQLSVSHPEPSIAALTQVYFLVTVYPVNLTPDLYKVSYDANGGTGQRDFDTAQPNNAILLPDQVFTRPGYTMVGWQGTVNGTKAVWFLGSYYTVTGNTTLYAYWVANPNIVVFNSNGGDNGSIDPYIAYTDGQISLPTAGLTKTGYTLQGWFLQTDRNAIYPLGYVYTIGDNVTFYAYWIQNGATTRSLNVSSNGGTGDYTQILEPGKKAVLPVAGIQKEKGLLSGFDTTAGETAPAYLPGSTFTVNANSTVYAIWLDNTAQTLFTVSFNLNGGSGSVTPQHVAVGGKATKPTTIPTKAASVFSEWDRQNGGPWDWSTVVTEDTTLFAQYDQHFSLSQSDLTVTIKLSGKYAGSSGTTLIDWGDGNVSTDVGSTASHTYAEAMSGTITVTTTYDDGITDNAKATSSTPFAVSGAAEDKDKDKDKDKDQDQDQDKDKATDWMKIAILALVCTVLCLLMFACYFIIGPWSFIFGIPISVVVMAILYWVWYL